MAKARTIGSRLKELREELGHTQAEFAARFGVAARTAQSYERDEAPPSAAFLKALADNDVDLNELLTGRALRRAPSNDPAAFTAIVTSKSKLAQQPGELDLEVLQPVLREAIEEAQSAKDIDWARTTQRFAATYARNYGAMRGRK
jgi:transcriptional regulator with XRE-family HTH domain